MAGKVKPKKVYILGNILLIAVYTMIFLAMSYMYRDLNLGLPMFIATICPLGSILIIIFTRIIREKKLYPVAFIALCVTTVINLQNIKSFAGIVSGKMTGIFLKISQSFSWYVPFLLLLLLFYNVLVIPREKDLSKRIPSLFVIFVQFILLIIPTFVVLSKVFGIPIKGFLATSGLLTAIIGLAVQSNLSNIVSGLFLNIEKPFLPGDWVNIGDLTGKVMDISWRTTKIATVKNTLVSIPNKEVAQAKIENLQDRPLEPENGFFIFVSFCVHPHHDPELVLQLVYDALKRVKPVDGRIELGLQWAVLNEFNSKGQQYYIVFDCLDRYQMYNQKHAVLSKVHHVLSQAGITMTQGEIRSRLDRDVGLTALSSFNRTLEDYKSLKESTSNVYFEAIKNEVMLSRVEIFRVLSEEDFRYLAENSKRKRYALDEYIIKQHEEGSTMYVIAEGVVNVEITDKNGNIIEVARLGVTDFFGEMALLTGEPRTASIKAIRPCVALEVSKETMAHLLNKNPDLHTRLSQILAQRKVGLSEAYALSEKQQEEIQSIASKFKLAIMKFFN